MTHYRKQIDPANFTLVIERSFAAPKATLWRVWSERDLLEKWWGPKEWPTRIHEFDFRVDGRWHYCMTGPDGTQAWGLAIYTDISPGIAIGYDDYFSDSNGGKDSALPAMKVHVEFVDAQRDTLVVTKSTFKRLEDLQKIVEMGFEQGFASSGDKLDELLQALHA